MPKSPDDMTRLQELLKLMSDNDLVEIEIAHGDERVVLKRAQPHSPASVPMATWTGPMPAPSVSEGHEQPAAAGQAPDDTLIDITSPIVGTFYQAPSPDAEPYVKVGSSVGEDTVVCIIEAMKVMNEIKAEVSGTIQQVLVQNGQAVEYGQPLFKVKPL